MRKLLFVLVVLACLGLSLGDGRAQEPGSPLQLMTIGKVDWIVGRWVGVYGPDLPVLMRGSDGVYRQPAVWSKRTLTIYDRDENPHVITAIVIDGVVP